ncbi:UNVERIFIED_CONTAM: hypothetical protein FKN15_052062 [Acipenser sinensis]
MTVPPYYAEWLFVDIEEERVRSAGLTTMEPFNCKKVPVKALLSQDHHNDSELLGSREFGSNSSSDK